MVQFLQTSVAQTVIWCTVLAVLLVFAYFFVLRFRDNAVEDESDTNELLSNFRELHERGTLSEEEYRTIKTKLGSKLQQELKRTGEKGSDES